MFVDNATLVKNIIWQYKKKRSERKNKKYMKYIKISENKI